MPPRTLTAVGRYRVRERLGSGAFGDVYRAFDPQLERDVALKVLRPEMTASPAAVERFLREARAAAKLRHPHIVPVFDAGLAGDAYYIASAFIAGRTLAAAIAGGPAEARRAAEWAAQLASALGCAHRNGVLHRDVKPANAMLDEEGALQLMDFGLAGWTDEECARLTRAGAVMGTPAYMSPEQARGDTALVGPASDLYGAGTVLYEMLTGRRPFEARQTAALVYQIVHQDPTPPSRLRADLDPTLEAICLRAMAKRPGDRYATGEEMAAALRAWQVAGPAVAQSPAPWYADAIPASESGPAAQTTISPADSAPIITSPILSRPTGRRAPLSGIRLGLLSAAVAVLLTGVVCTGVAVLALPGPAVPPAPAPVRPSATATADARPPAVVAAKDKAATVEGDKRAKRALRWSMNFNTRDGADYLRQLEALGAILAVPAGANHYKVVDLSKHPYQPEDRDLSTIQRVWWIDGNAQSVANLMAAMGLPDRPPRVIAFIPQELENELAKKELDYQGIKEDEIFETRFQVFGAGGKYDVRVVGQKRK